MLRDGAQQKPADDSCVHKIWRNIAYELLLELGRNAELICEVVVKLHFEQSPRCCQCSTKNVYDNFVHR